MNQIRERDQESSVLSLEVQDSLLQKRTSKNISVNASGFVVSIIEEPGNSDTKVEENVIKGVSLMMGAVLCITTAHALVKYASFRSPYLRPYDFMTFMGITLTTFNIVFARVTKNSLNIFTYGKKAVFLLILRTLAGMVGNFTVMYGISHVPLSKGVFIFSLAPVCCAILASIFLKEVLTKTTIICMIGGAIGIYILTQGKSNTKKDGTLLGYFSLVIAMWASATVFVSVKALAIYKIHSSVVSSIFGISFLLQPLVFLLFGQNVLSFEQYTLFDICILSFHGCLAVTWITFIYFASTYTRASLISPMMNLENIFTIFLDLFLFHYHFTNYDIVGMTTVAVLIGILITKNLRG